MKTLKDIDITNKIVIIRFDYNVPIKDGKILDDTRIIKSLNTLNYVLERAKKTIVLSHLGRIKTIEDKNNNSLRIVCDYLSSLINKKIGFYEYTDDTSVIENNNIIMFENTRYFDLDNNKESNCDNNLSKYFASFGEVFINDAFGVSHRENASNTGISKLLPSCNGFLIEEEISNLSKLINNPERPYTIILGGKKVSDKIKLIDNLINKVDNIIIGGAMSYTFLKSIGYNIGKSYYEEDYLDYCKDLLKRYNNKIIPIKDNYVEGKELKDIDEISDNDIGLDIGPKSVELFKEVIFNSNTIFFNGPMGLFEDGYDYGTKEICRILNDSKAYVVVGGGDTVNAVNKYIKNNTFIISTGGGASLEFLEGKKLPGVIE